MSSILDALKKVEDDHNGPEDGVELNEEIDADAAEHDIVAADSDARKVTVRLTPAVMLITLVVAAIVVAGIAGVTVFMTRPDTSAVPPGRMASAPRVPPGRPAVPPQAADAPNTTQPATAPAVAQPEPAAAEPAPAVAQPEPAAAEPAPAVAQPEPVAAEPAPAVAQPEPAAAEPAPAVAQPVPAAAEPTPAAREPAGDVVAEELRPAQPKPQQAVPSQQAAVPAPAEQPVQPPVARPAQPPALLPVETAATLAFDEPPPDIQSVTLPVTVPPLEINIIRAANAESPNPVAVINLKTVYEGDLIADTGIRVLKINDNDVWFSYQGYRFRKRFK